MAIKVNISEDQFLKQIFDDAVLEQTRVCLAHFCIKLTERLGFVLSDEDRKLIKAFTESQSNAFTNALATTREYNVAMNDARQHEIR